MHYTSFFNDVFPYKVCINLDRRPDRWAQMQQQFTMHGIQAVQRFAALDGQQLAIPSTWTQHSPGAYGCLQSHLAVITQARAAAQPCVFIFEDDVVFDPQFQAKFTHFYDQVPAHWDMLFFGGIHLQRPVRISENVYKVRWMLATHAYAVRHTVYDAYIDVNQHINGPVDQNNALLQERFNGYCCYPYPVWQQDGYSDINEVDQKNWGFKDFFVWNEAEIACAQRCTGLIFYHQNPYQDQLRTVQLKYLLGFYRQHFPALALTVVEQGTRPTLHANRLPPYCGYAFLESHQKPDKTLAFAVGLQSWQNSKAYAVVSDTDVVFVSEHDVTANLLMFAQYDGVSFFQDEYFLSEADTNKVLAGRLHDVAVSAYVPHCKTTLAHGICGVTRQAVQRVGGWGQLRPYFEGSMHTLGAETGLQIYRPPFHVLRLWHRDG